MAAAHKDRSRLHAALQRSVNHIFEALSYFSETSLGNWAPGWTLSMMDGPWRRMVTRRESGRPEPSGRLREGGPLPAKAHVKSQDFRAARGGSGRRNEPFHS